MTMTKVPSAKSGDCQHRFRRSTVPTFCREAPAFQGALGRDASRNPVLLPIQPPAHPPLSPTQTIHIPPSPSAVLDFPAEANTKPLPPPRPNLDHTPSPNAKRPTNRRRRRFPAPWTRQAGAQGAALFPDPSINHHSTYERNTISCASRPAERFGKRSRCEKRERLSQQRDDIGFGVRDGKAGNQKTKEKKETCSI